MGLQRKLAITFDKDPSTIGVAVIFAGIMLIFLTLAFWAFTWKFIAGMLATGLVVAVFGLLLAITLSALEGDGTEIKTTSHANDRWSDKWQRVPDE